PNDVRFAGETRPKAGQNRPVLFEATGLLRVARGAFVGILNDPMLSKLWRDLVELSKAVTGNTAPRTLVLAALQDSFWVLVLSRLRTSARRHRIVGVNRVLRMAQTTLYGLEIGKDVDLGRGVYFVHTVGTVIGGDAKIGNRVRFMGNNTIGTAKD